MVAATARHTRRGHDQAARRIEGSLRPVLFYQCCSTLQQVASRYEERAGVTDGGMEPAKDSGAFCRAPVGFATSHPHERSRGLNKSAARRFDTGELVLPLGRYRAETILSPQIQLAASQQQSRQPCSPAWSHSAV